MPDTIDLFDVEPIYETWPGWDTPTREARTWNELPKNARNYLHRITRRARWGADSLRFGWSRAR